MTLLPPDSDERVFARVVEAGSLKAVAEQMGHDPSAISRRISALEARLGQRLLRRSTRGSRPTELGARYYAGLSQLLSQQDALEAAVAGAQDRPQGTLRVTAPPEFGTRFVVPVLQALSDAHPALDVELSLGTGFFDLDLQDIDVAIRIGVLHDSALVARKLGNVPRCIVGAPCYLRTHGQPRSVDGLQDHRFLAYRSTRGTQTLSLRTPDGQRRELTVHAAFTVNSVTTLTRMAEAGKGLLYGATWSVRDALDGGRLHAVLPDHQLDAAPLHALYRDRRYQPAKTRAFIEAMADHIAGEPGLQAPTAAA